MKTHRILPAILTSLIFLGTAPLTRAEVPGTPDSFDANVGGFSVSATAIQTDGKTILVGSFTSVLGVPRGSIARLNADGSLDMGFNPKTVQGNIVKCVAVQADGKILLGGACGFTSRQPKGAPAAPVRMYAARLNADGSLDASFEPNPNSDVYSVVVQSDGKILLGGEFTTLQPSGAAAPTARNKIARLNADGSLDVDFDPNASSTVKTIAVQADGKILIGGQFNTLQPNGAATASARDCVARLNADGSLEKDFDPKADSWVDLVATQVDGKILLGGNFTTLQPNGAATPTTRKYAARLNADGSLDKGFDPNADSDVFCMAVQTDGKVLLGGKFTTLQPNGAASATARSKVARVNADGSLDAGFDPKADGFVESVVVQADGKILLAGRFTTLQPNGATSAIKRGLFARLNK